MKTLALMAAAAAFAVAAPAVASTPQQTFMARLNSLCGERFEGRVVTDDPADADFAGSRLVMHVRDCSSEEVRIPFAVGEDRSRTWVVSRNAESLRLKHDHRGADGRPEGLHWYGGSTIAEGSDRRQEFPADAFSVELFQAWDAEVSTTNVWAIEVEPGQLFAYELRRPSGRFFRVEFDLTRPLED